MGKLIDMTGKKFGKLTVKYRDPKPHAKPYLISFVRITSF